MKWCESPYLQFTGYTSTCSLNQINMPRWSHHTGKWNKQLKRKKGNSKREKIQTINHQCTATKNCVKDHHQGRAATLLGLSTCCKTREKHKSNTRHSVGTSRVIYGLKKKRKPNTPSINDKETRKKTSEQSRNYFILQKHRIDTLMLGNNQNIKQRKKIIFLLKIKLMQ